MSETPHQHALKSSPPDILNGSSTGRVVFTRRLCFFLELYRCWQESPGTQRFTLCVEPCRFRPKVLTLDVKASVSCLPHAAQSTVSSLVISGLKSEKVLSSTIIRFICLIIQNRKRVDTCKLTNRTFIKICDISLSLAFLDVFKCVHGRLSSH